jgi:hypothetical protein
MKRAPRAARRGRKFRSRPGGHDGLSVIVAYGNRALTMIPQAYARHRVGKSVIVCRDGYRLSVIAGPGTNCSPRPSMIQARPYLYDLAGEKPPGYHGPYHQVDVLLYGEEPHWWKQVTVLAGVGEPVRLPVPVVRRLIQEHGGFARMQRHRGLRTDQRQLAETVRWYRAYSLRQTRSEAIGVVPTVTPMPDNHQRGG